MRILAARIIVTSSEEVLPGGGLLLAGGRVLRVVKGRAALRRLARNESLPITEVGDGVLAPGLVNAHAHLELSALAGRVPFHGSFSGWVQCLLRGRAALSAHALRKALRKSADEMLLTGTTAVGDIDSSGLTQNLGRHPLRLRAYREVLDGGDPDRCEAAATRVTRALPRRETLLEGISPHAPYSVSEGLMSKLARIARRRGVPLAIHWAETKAEAEWMKKGSGDFEALCKNSPGRSGLELLEGSGLLGPSTSLIHGNFPARGEIERIARSGATLVHCPGSHAFFGRTRFPLARYRDAGVEVALGTDSLASNEALDMRREMALMRRSHRAVAPSEVWRMATEAGARALYLEGHVGCLRAGFLADMAHFDLPAAQGAEALFDALTADTPEVRATWIAGRRRKLEHSDA